jgi:hypothetical protein
MYRMYSKVLVGEVRIYICPYMYSILVYPSRAVDSIKETERYTGDLKKLYSPSGKPFVNGEWSHPSPPPPSVDKKPGTVIKQGFGPHLYLAFSAKASQWWIVP